VIRPAPGEPAGRPAPGEPAGRPAPGGSLQVFTKPIPDRDSAPWWEAVRRHELLLQKCVRCTALRFPPRAVCNTCQSRETAWVPAAGTATVQSWIVTHHVFTRPAAGAVPYVVALVRLDDGDDLLMYGNIVTTDDAGGVIAADPRTIMAGMPVEAVFTDLADECTLVQWRAKDGPTAQATRAAQEGRSNP
jgi:uncharacterized OB-fold protein